MKELVSIRKRKIVVESRVLTVQMILRVASWSRGIVSQKVAFSGRLHQRLTTCRFYSLGHDLNS